MRQLEILRFVGSAVDESDFRREHGLRARDALTEQRRRLHDRTRRMDGEIRDQRLSLRRALDPEAAARLKDLDAERKSIDSQIASAERADAESAAKLKSITEFSAPWRAVEEAVLRHFGLSRADAGIPYGHDVPRSVRPDVVIGGGR